MDSYCHSLLSELTSPLVRTLLQKRLGGEVEFIELHSKPFACLGTGNHVLKCPLTGDNPHCDYIALISTDRKDL